MVKRPADLDPENFVIGNSWYAFGHPAVAYADEKQFLIGPAPPQPLPVFRIVVLHLVYVLFFGGFLWFGLTHHDPDVSESVIYAVVAGAGVVACGGTIAVPLIARSLTLREQARGPWLRYDKGTRQVELPRQRLTFELNEIVYLQYVSTNVLQQPRSIAFQSSKNSVSELNLVTVRDGKRKRWNLVNSSSPSGAFEAVLDPLVEQTPIPVVRITETAGPWKVWIRPYCNVMKPASTVQADRLGSEQ